MTAIAWSDHIIEPGPLVPPCAGCAAWAEAQPVMAAALNAARAERDRALRWSRRWRDKTRDNHLFLRVMRAERDAALRESEYLAYAMRCAIQQTPLLTREEWAAVQAKE